MNVWGNNVLYTADSTCTKHTIYMMPSTSTPNSNKGISQSDSKRVMDAFNRTRTSVKHHPSYLMKEEGSTKQSHLSESYRCYKLWPKRWCFHYQPMPCHTTLMKHILWGSHILWFAWTLSETHNLFNVVSLSYRWCSTIMLSWHTVCYGLLTWRYLSTFLIPRMITFHILR
jgi:hypothetical protein